MKREKSWARQLYEIYYRKLRRGMDYEYLSVRNASNKEIINGADYSYQAKDCRPNGWVSDLRWKRFWEIKWRILTQCEELSF